MPLDAMHAAVQITHLVNAMPAAENPFSGIAPSFDFGPAFNTLWKKLFGLGWGAAIIASVSFTLYNLTKAGKGSVGSNPHEVTQAKGAFKTSLLVTAGVIAFGVLMTALFYVI